jgi:plasmid stability protein
MADVIVRDLSPDIVERLEIRARRHGRSLQGEVKAILESASTLSLEEARRLSGAWRLRLSGRPFSDSAELLQEDRAR